MSYYNKPIPVKLEAFTDASFKYEAFYGADFKNVFYSCVGFGRPLITTTKEQEENELKLKTTQYQNSITEINFTVWAHNALVDFLSHIELHDVIQLTIIDTGEVISLQNVRTEDAGDRGEILEGFTFFAELAPALDACEDSYELTP